MSKAKKLSNRPRTKGFVTRFFRLLAHRYFFIGILLFFALQMLWVALSASYPMLFDEEYHLGIIEVYSRQISPIIAIQPPEAAFHGDITRYGSYFFHYIMSFPYRLITVFTSDLQTQVILMRGICISFVLLGLVVFRKVLLNIKFSRATTHSVLLIFTLIPIVPFALSQLNYDSLAFLFVPVMFLFSQKVVSNDKQRACWLALLISAGSLAAITKFTTLPIFLGCLVFVSIHIWKQHGKKFAEQIWGQYKKIPDIRRIAISLLLLVSIGLFIERYAVNIVTYHALEPRCNRVHTKDECMNYTVFRRDTTWKQANDAKNKPRNDAIHYTTHDWAPHIFGDLFVVGTFVRDNDPTIEIRELPTNLQASGGSKVLRFAGIGTTVVLTILLMVYFRSFIRIKTMQLFLIAILIYVTALWIKNYTDYLSIGVPVATQGRYFIPFLIPLLSMLAVVLTQLSKRYDLRLFLLIVALACFSQGGGVASYILYSKPNWYWPENNRTISSVNNTARQFLRSFTIR